MLITQNILGLTFFVLIAATCFQVTKKINCLALNESQKLKLITQALHNRNSYGKRIPECSRRLHLKNEDQQIVLQDSFGEITVLEKPDWWRERKSKPGRRLLPTGVRSLSSTLL